MNTQLVPIAHHALDEVGMLQREFSYAKERASNRKLTKAVKYPVGNDPDSFLLNGRVGSKILEIEGETHRPIHGFQV
jgi:hypothetical protein